MAVLTHTANRDAMSEVARPEYRGAAVVRTSDGCRWPQPTARNRKQRQRDADRCGSVFSTRRAVRSGASLQHADRQVSREHRLARITRQPCIGLGSNLRTIAGLLQLHHEVVIR